MYVAVMEGTQSVNSYLQQKPQQQQDMSINQAMQMMSLTSDEADWADLHLDPC